MNNPVDQFEKKLADFFGAPYAVAVDSCTHAVELSLRYLKSDNVTCPKQTYPSIPMTLVKLGLSWQFVDQPWSGYYYIGNTPVIDAATWWKKNSFIKNSFMCLSFQTKKHLSLGRCGAILVPSLQDYQTLKMMSYDGRRQDVPWKDQDISMIGYHYYMTYEIAEQALQKFDIATTTEARIWSSSEYPDLSTMKVFDDRQCSHN